MLLPLRSDGRGVRVTTYLCLVARTETHEAAPSTFLYASSTCLRGLRRDKIALNLRSCHVFAGTLFFSLTILTVRICCEHVLKFNAGITIAELSTLLPMN